MTQAALIPSCSEKQNDQNAILDPTPFIGKPYRVGARGPDAYDCWGLVMACCPWLPDDWADEALAARRVMRIIADQARDPRWRRENEPVGGAVAILGTGHRATHTGLLWATPAGVMLVHAQAKVGVVAQPLPHVLRQGLNLKGVYTWLG